MLVAMKQVKKCLEASSPTLQPFICKENIWTVSGTKLLGLLNHTLSMFHPPEALLIHTLSKSYYLIRELFPTNLLSFQEPVTFGIPYLTLPFLNTITYLASNLFLFLPLSGLCYRLYWPFPDITYKKGRLLGVQIDENLMWKIQINSVT